MPINWKEELEEYGELHNEDCDVNSEGGSFDGCHCPNMELIKHFIEAYVIEKMLADILFTQHEIEVKKRQIRAKWLGEDSNA
jgi:hypothetical protein